MAMLKLLCLAAPLASSGLHLMNNDSDAPQAPQAPAEGAPIPERPALIPPRDLTEAGKLKPAKVLSALAQVGATSKLGPAENAPQAFQPSAAFQAAAATEQENEMRGQEERRIGAESAVDLASDLPWGIGSPRTGDSLVNFHKSGMPSVDFPKETEYSLEAGDNIRSFSSSRQDVKLITQVLMNITNGFFLDTNAGDGEMNSNTMLLELLGWRGLLLEPRIYWYMNLWGKMRKSWTFLGTLSPDEKARKIGFDTEGKVDMLSGRMAHAYPLKAYMAEMGGRKSIDFWNLNIGGFEYEALNQTLMGEYKIEIGCILMTFVPRIAGRGNDPWVTERSKDTNEDLIFSLMHNASFKYLGGLDAYFVNKVTLRTYYHDHLWCDPAYFEKRGIPLAASIKSAPPHPVGSTAASNEEASVISTWDGGFTEDEEIAMIVNYTKASKASAKSSEDTARAHRVHAAKLVTPKTYTGYVNEHLLARP